ASAGRADEEGNAGRNSGAQQQPQVTRDRVGREKGPAGAKVVGTMVGRTGVAADDIRTPGQRAGERLLREAGAKHAGRRIETKLRHAGMIAAAPAALLSCRR